VSDGEASTSNSASTRVSDFCACWPPGPLDLDVRKRISARAIETPRVTWIRLALDSPAMAAILAIGVDLIEIGRVRRTLERYGDFRARCFTEAERAYCDSRPNPAQHYAARFAGKEAVGKALGFGVAVHFAWREVEIAGRPKPSVRLSGRLAERAERLGVGEVELSMTHSKELAAAVAVAADV
jgi:holo-[acyl-carrier protein] synthase